MRKQKLFQAILPNYENLKQPLTVMDEGIAALLEIAVPYRRDRCPNANCRKNTITRKLLFYEEIAPTKIESDLLEKLIFGSEADEPWKTTRDLWLCKCTSCETPSWLEVTVTRHCGTKPGEPLSPEIRVRK